MKALRYRWLRHRGYRVDEIVNVRVWDDIFSSPPVVCKRWAKLEMRRGLSVRTIHFRRFKTADDLAKALLEASS